MKLPRNILVKKSLLAGHTCMKLRLLESAVRKKGRLLSVDFERMCTEYWSTNKIQP